MENSQTVKESNEQKPPNDTTEKPLSLAERRKLFEKNASGANNETKSTSQRQSAETNVEIKVGSIQEKIKMFQIGNKSSELNNEKRLSNDEQLNPQKNNFGTIQERKSILEKSHTTSCLDNIPSNNSGKDSIEIEKRNPKVELKYMTSLAEELEENERNPSIDTANMKNIGNEIKIQSTPVKITNFQNPILKKADSEEIPKSPRMHQNHNCEHDQKVVTEPPMNFSDIKNKLGTAFGVAGIGFGIPPKDKTKHCVHNLEEKKINEKSEEDKLKLLEERTKAVVKKPRKNKVEINFE